MQATYQAFVGQMFVSFMVLCCPCGFGYPAAVTQCSVQLSMHATQGVPMSYVHPLTRRAAFHSRRLEQFAAETKNLSGWLLFNVSMPD